MSILNHINDEEVRQWKKSSIVRHDLFNFESKIDYGLELTEKNTTKYLITTYFFIPRSLIINRDSYSKEQFFSDLNNRIRFKTPKMSIEEILNEQNELSPMYTILRSLNSIEDENFNIETITRFQRELCLLADIIKVSFRDQFNYIHYNYNEINKQYHIPDLIHNYLKSIERLQSKLTTIRNRINLSQIPIKSRESFQFVDEYISLQIERWLTKILKIFEEKINQESKLKMIELIEKEQIHREHLNSSLIISENNSNENFSYQEGILKKYMQSVLYLEKKKKDPRSQSLEIFYSLAAGVAMFFSLFFGFFLLSFFPLYSIPFIFVSVVIYMLKDRIKENIRGISQKAVGSLFSDQRIDIVDGFNKEKIGKSTEIVNFKIKDKIPREILRIRRSSNINSIEERGKPEEVIVYKKKIILFNKKIRQFHTRRREISDVIRFNIREFLRYADDPIQFISKWNVDKHKIENIPISKVYHLNLILKLTEFKGKKIKKTSFKKFRVIIDQKGIKRVLEPEFVL
ncbi:MAG: hypothetical protein ACFFDY_14850 [Candidatus Thorarchaeota archaeon]